MLQHAGLPLKSEIMKKIYFLIGLISNLVLTAQITIGKDSLSSETVLLEFGNENKGLILPWVISINDVDADSNAVNSNGATSGTFVFDSSDNRIKLKKNSTWMDLSGTDGTSDRSQIINRPESLENGVVIGSLSTSARGILIIESNDQAMVLPKVDSFEDIVDPSPGMVVFVKSTKMLAVFNGEVWSFWKP